MDLRSYRRQPKCRHCLQFERSATRVDHKYSTALVAGHLWEGERSLQTLTAIAESLPIRDRGLIISTHRVRKRITRADGRSI